MMLIIASMYGLTAVVLGAFAAHGLKGKLSEPLLNAFQTGVQYQMFHALFILIIAIWVKVGEQHPNMESALPSLQWSMYLAALGVVLFSGSLYALALTGVKWFGPITPIGGVCLIAGWGCLLFASIKLLGSPS